MVSRRGAIFMTTCAAIVAFCLAVTGWTQTRRTTTEQPPVTKTVPGTRQQTDQQHWLWVHQSLERMKTITVGMTRQQLMQVFTGAGGARVVPPEVFEYRGCPWFQVEVEFLPVGKPPRDSQGRYNVHNDPTDIIARISRPYVADTWFSLLPDNQPKLLRN